MPPEVYREAFAISTFGSSQADTLSSHAGMEAPRAIAPEP